MDVRPLALVSFAGADADTELRSRLASIGYEPRSLSPAQVRDGAMGSWPGALVLLLGKPDLSRDRVLSVIESARTAPSLALVLDGEAQWDKDVIERCSDVSRWPCTGDELAFRLGRLCGQDGRRDAAAMDPELSDTLARLNLIGDSRVFLQTMGQVRRLAACDAPVLIGGETGTGKELVARAIHYLGTRSGGPFVPVNCGALPDNLVENELFGHERGAYTDAGVAAEGAIGEAAGGTLFLDEVETLSVKAQVALLRLLQNREYRRLGGRGALKSDARVLAATNADLRALCDRREFRPDLFFRLDILSLRMPPLRRRPEDIQPLASHFIDLYCARYALEPRSLDPRSLPSLMAHSWPGNVRELENLVHRTLLLSDSSRLMLRPEAPDAEAGAPGDEGPGDPFSGSFAEAKAHAIASFERAYLVRLMAETGGNVTQAARRAAKERRSLGKLLKKHAITSGSQAS